MTEIGTPSWLAALHERCFTVPRPFTETEFADLLDAETVFLCAEEKGFALGRVIAGEAELLTIAVAPDARRRGIGGSLMRSFLAEAKARDGDVAFLEVDAANSAARALYDAVGFVEVGRRKGYYRHNDGHATDALVLRRGLSDDDRLQLEDR